MTREQVREIVKEIGVKKGCRLECPDDFYKGLTKEDLYEYTKNKSTACYFRQVNDIIMECFPDHIFYEWKFKYITKEWWLLEENKIKFLRWLEKEMGWTKPEDWYNISKKILSLNYGHFFTNNYNCLVTPSILYPNYEFLPWKFKNVPKGWWNNINNITFFLKWLEKELGWSKPEDWYNITVDILCSNYGRTLLHTYNINDLPSILYPNFSFKEECFKNVTRNFWENFDNIKNILLDFYIINGRLPTQNECNTLNGKTIIRGLSNFGGLHKIAEMLNLEINSGMKTISGHIVLSSYEVILDNFLYLNNIPFQYEGKIVENKRYKYDFKINDIYIEIWGYQNQADYRSELYNKKRILKEKVYKENNLKLISIEYNLFEKNTDKINEYLIKLMKEYNIKQSDFYCENISKLTYFNSFDKEEEYMKDLRNECIKRGFDTIPKFTWWVENGFCSQITFLSKNGKKLSVLAKEFGLKLKTKPKFYWNDFSIIENEFINLCNIFGKFPTAKQLLSVGRSDLIHAAERHHGGLISIKIKMGYIPFYL